MEIKTLKDLKEFLNTLNDIQLSEKAILQGVDRPGHDIKSAGTLKEDYFINEEGADPVSTFEPDDEDDVLENYTIIPAGTPYLCEE